MEYILKNGKKLTVRRAAEDNAEGVLNVLCTADSETRFLAREPEEKKPTVERERQMLSALGADPDSALFAAEYDSKIVGICSVGLVRKNLRFRHRANVSFVVLKDFWGLGIGGKMMEECITWCKEHGVEQIELDVVTENERAVNMYKSFGFRIIGTLPHALRYADGTYADEYYMLYEV